MEIDDVGKVPGVLFGADKDRPLLTQPSMTFVSVQGESQSCSATRSRCEMASIRVCSDFVSGFMLTARLTDALAGPMSDTSSDRSADVNQALQASSARASLS